MRFYAVQKGSGKSHKYAKTFVICIQVGLVGIFFDFFIRF